MIVKSAARLLADKWVKDVDTHSNLPEGTFQGSASDIAKTLKSKSKDLKQAMSRLNFYINRGGDNLSSSEKSKLESAKEKLRKLYGE